VALYIVAPVPYLNPRPARKPYGIKTSHLEKPGEKKMPAPLGEDIML
jgi:hypothetical protein